MTVAADGTVLSANPAAHRLFGLAPVGLRAQTLLWSRGSASEEPSSSSSPPLDALAPAAASGPGDAAPWRWAELLSHTDEASGSGARLPRSNNKTPLESHEILL
eukprot:tig00020660_g12549.t1